MPWLAEWWSCLRRCIYIEIMHGDTGEVYLRWTVLVKLWMVRYTYQRVPATASGLCQDHTYSLSSKLSRMYCVSLDSCYVHATPSQIFHLFNSPNSDTVVCLYRKNASGCLARRAIYRAKKNSHLVQRRFLCISFVVISAGVTSKPTMLSDCSPERSGSFTSWLKKLLRLQVWVNGASLEARPPIGNLFNCCQNRDIREYNRNIKMKTETVDHQKVL